MKKILACVFTIIGTVIGAGFISGRELLSFFGTKGFLPSAVVSAVVFFLLVFFLLDLGYRSGGYLLSLRRFPRFTSILFNVFLNVGCFIVSSGMVAGINGVFPDYSPLFGAIALIVAAVVVVFGMRVIGVLNAILVPIILIFLAVVLVKDGEFCYEPTPFSFFSAVNGATYAGLNIFLSVPVVADLGRGMKRGKLISALLFSLVLLFYMILILFAVSGNEESENKAFPLLYVLGKYPFFLFVSLSGTMTTLISSYYPLWEICSLSRHKITANALVALAVFLLSLFGFENIVDFVYPVLGSVGFLLLLFACLYYFLFEKHDGGVHPGSHHAKKGDGGHDEV